jgi:quercetin dioxygenase-like cupin family protein
MSVRLVSWEEEDGPLTEKRLMGVLEREGYEVAVYAYRQGTVFPEHEHAQEKCDAVVEGFLRISVGETVYDLKPGDRLYLPAGTRHSAEVIGRRTVVSLDGTLW